MIYIKLSQYAKNNGITYGTALRHYKQNKIPNIKVLETGTILVGVPLVESKNKVNNNVAIYTRVSSNKMKDNLERQLIRLNEYAISNGYNVVKAVKEISSGMNDKRKKLIELLLDDSYSLIIVEHKDRLTRFGFNYIETLLLKQDKRIIVANTAQNDNENLMEDLISIIYSFSARMYGKRNLKNKTQKVIAALKKEEENATC
jgi:predicted site-specific integrase-resolvase